MKTKLMMTTAIALAMTASLAGAQTTSTDPNRDRNAPSATQDNQTVKTPKGASTSTSGSGAVSSGTSATTPGSTTQGAASGTAPASGNGAANTSANDKASPSQQSAPSTAQSAQPRATQPAAQNNATQPNAAPQNNTAQTPNVSGRAAAAGSTDANARTQISASLRTEQKTELNRAISRLDVRPVQNVNFSISVGTAVPRSVSLHPVPTQIVAVIPQYRGYSYFVVRDEVIIVEPRTSRIVDVIVKSGGPSQARAITTERTKVDLSSKQRSYLRQHTSRREITTTGSAPRSTTTRTVVVGERVPDAVEIMSFPEEVYREVPSVRTYRYIQGERGVYLVDPSSRLVIDDLDD